MLKVTLKFGFYCVLFLSAGCSGGKIEPDENEIIDYTDSVSERRIDSAYAAITSACDTQMIYRVPQMVDSLLKDSSLGKAFFDTTDMYTDANKKVEKLIRQLQADCDSNLLKETYKRVQLRKKLKPVQHKKSKA
jgi:hypothetical protein